MIDPSEGEQAEKVFRSFQENRDKLRKAMLVLQEPLRILDLKRRFEEQTHHNNTLGSPDQVSIRLHSMKIGREQLLDDLWALTKPIKPEIPDNPESTYSEENNLT